MKKRLLNELRTSFGREVWTRAPKIQAEPFIAWCFPEKSGGEIIWGTADVTWGATVTDGRGDVGSSISTTCPSESQDIETIAEVIRSHSIDATRHHI
jgi:hypothetical protein